MKLVVVVLGVVAAASSAAAGKLTQVRYDEPRIDGAFERMVVINAFPAESKVVACARTITRNYVAMDVKLEVDGNGTINVMPLTVFDDASHRCLTSVFSAMKLGKPKDGKDAKIGIFIELYAGVIPTVSLGAPAVVGTLDKATVSRYVKRDLAKVADCYESVQAKKKTLRGKTKAEFFITPNGNVSNAKISGLHDDAVEDCVLGVVNQLEFPKPMSGGGTQVTYPISFQPPKIPRRL